MDQKKLRIWTLLTQCMLPKIKKNFIELFLSIILLAIFSSDDFQGISSLSEFLRKIVYLVFLTLNDNFLALNYCPILFNSSFTVVKKALML